MRNLSKWVILLTVMILAFSPFLFLLKPTEGTVLAHNSQDGYKQPKFYVLPTITIPVATQAPTPTPTVKTTPEPTNEPSEDIKEEYMQAQKKVEPRGIVMTMEASAYTISIAETGNLKGETYTGTKATKNRTLSVDPRVIPLGSLVYIKSDSKLVAGYYVAEDTGSAIKGKKLDVFMGKGKADYKDAMNFGRRKVQVTIIRKGYDNHVGKTS